VGKVAQLRVGHAAFGVAFIAIGVAWLLRSAGLDFDIGWIVAIAALALGLAGFVTTIAVLVLPARDETQHEGNFRKPR
jgi:apolipoprotein N-acyltransferase